MSSRINEIANELGLKRVDAKGRLPVVVTDLDVRKASRKDPANCGFARACKARIPGVKAAYFFKSTAWLQFADRLVRYHMPPSMEKEIVSFDRNRTMEPGTYYLTPPSPAVTMKALKERYQENKRGLGRNSSKAKPKSRRHIRHQTTNVRASGW